MVLQYIPTYLAFIICTYTYLYTWQRSAASEIDKFLECKEENESIRYLPVLCIGGIYSYKYRLRLLFDDVSANGRYSYLYIPRENVLEILPK